MPVVASKSADALTGLFYGGGFKVLEAQRIGSFIVCAATFATAMAMFSALKAVNLLRVSAEGELEGLDVDLSGVRHLVARGHALARAAGRHARAGRRRRGGEVTPR